MGRVGIRCEGDGCYGLQVGAMVCAEEVSTFSAMTRLWAGLVSGVKVTVATGYKWAPWCARRR